MSRRRTRPRRRPAVRSSAAPLPLLIGAILGGLLGVLLAVQAAPHLLKPHPLPTQHWQIVSPGLEAAIYTPGLGRGTHIVDGALTIARHAFYRTENVTAVVPSPVARAELQLAADSDALSLRVGGSQDGQSPVQFLTLHRDWAQASLGRGPRLQTDGTGRFALYFQDGQFVLDAGGEPQVLGRSSPGGFEMGAVDGLSRVQALRLLDADGQVLVSEDYGSWARPTGYLAAGGALGALGGLLLAWVTVGASSLPGGLLAALLVLAPPVLTLLVPFTGWLTLVEKLYMVRTPAWELARIATALSLLPLAALVLLRSGLLALPLAREAGRRGRDSLLVWAGLALVTGAAALWTDRSLMGPLLVFTSLGLALPLRVALTQGLPRARWLAHDLPALAALLLLGWAPGLLAALGWRLLTLIAAVGTLLRRAPRPASDTLFLLLLLIPAAAELAVRDTYLGSTWDAQKLSLELTSSTDILPPDQAAWKGNCGAQSDPDPLVLAFAGGSSTGGAYQFGGEPEAFFAAQSHLRLCDALPQGRGLSTWNFGDGGRDTWVISQNIDAILDNSQADVIALYVGVNDLLTRHHTLTRKQREAVKAQRSAASRGLAGLASRSRLITAASLLARESQYDDLSKVPNVPLTDAEENLRAVVRAAAERDARVLLLTEFVAPASQAELRPYDVLQRRLAEELPGVSWLDVDAALAPHMDQGLLVDRNHLSRVGNALLADALTPELEGLLEW